MADFLPGMHEKLVQYLDGDLPESEHQELTRQLAADAVLQEQYDSLLQTREAIRQYGLQQQVASLHRQMMQEFSQAPVKKMPQSRRTLRYVLSIAASILLLVVGYMGYQFINLSAEKLYSSNYAHYDLSATRGAAPESVTAADKAYQEGNYREVVRLAATGTDQSSRSYFLAGASALELKDYTGAVSYFNKVLELNRTTGEKKFNDDAEYYLALTYIRTRDLDYALELLNKIKDDPEHTYNSKVSRSLIRKVKMLKWR